MRGKSLFILFLFSGAMWVAGLVLSVGLFVNRVVVPLSDQIVSQYEVRAEELGASPAVGPPRNLSVLLVVVDGLRPDFLSVGVGFPRLLREGASVRGATCRYVSVSYPGAATIGTGANQDTHGIIHNFFFTRPRVIQAESLFDVAQGTTCLVDYYEPPFYTLLFNESAVGPSSPIDALSLPGMEGRFDDPSWPRSVTDLAVSLHEEQSCRFSMLYISVDEEGHSYGAASPEYLARALANSDAVDSMLDTLPPNTLVLLTSDHGHLDIGGHGGTEPEVLGIPFVVWGPHVRSGVALELPDAEQHDLAVTLSYAMNVPPPRQSEGWPVLDLFDFGEADAVAYCNVVRRQRWELMSRRRLQLGLPPANASLLNTTVGSRAECIALGALYDAESDALRQRFLNTFEVAYLGWVLFAALALVLAGALVLLFCLWDGGSSDKARGFCDEMGWPLVIAVFYFVLFEVCLWTAWAMGYGYSALVNSISAIVGFPLIVQAICFAAAVVLLGTVVACRVRSSMEQGVAVAAFLCLFMLLSIVPDAATYGVYFYTSAGHPAYTFHSTFVAIFFIGLFPLWISLYFLLINCCSERREEDSLDFEM